MKSFDFKNALQRLSAVMLCLAVLVCAAPARAGESSSTDRRTVRVAFPVQSGMSEVGESGDLAGYNYNYLQNLAEYAGWDIEYITYDTMTPDEGISTAIQQVMSGEADLIGPILYSEALDSMFEFPENNYGVVYTTLCSLSSSSITAYNYTHKGRLRIAVYATATTRNQEVSDYLDQLGISYELVECEDTDAQYEALVSGRADLLSSITLSYFEDTRPRSPVCAPAILFCDHKGQYRIYT